MLILINSVRSLILFCLLFSYLKSEIIDEIRICALRVSFIQDSSQSTTGNGTFLTENLGIDCGAYVIDPPPHDKSYFQSQILAVSNYFKSVSYGKFSVNIDESTVYPLGEDDSYILPYKMNYYNPYDSTEIQEK